MDRHWISLFQRRSRHPWRQNRSIDEVMFNCNQFTWGMMVIFDRTSYRPIWRMSTLSMMISPLVGSMIRKSAMHKLLFPLPVRPMIPIYIQCKRYFDETSSVRRRTFSPVEWSTSDLSKPTRDFLDNVLTDGWSCNDNSPSDSSESSTTDWISPVGGQLLGGFFSGISHGASGVSSVYSLTRSTLTILVSISLAIRTSQLSDWVICMAYVIVRPTMPAVRRPRMKTANKAVDKMSRLAITSRRTASHLDEKNIRLIKLIAISHLFETQLAK